MRLTEAEAIAMKALAVAISKQERCRPRRIYLGEGIWWTPPARYWRHAVRRALLEPGKEGK